MTSHGTWREQLQRLLDDELSPAERARLGRHLATCAECRTELAQLRALAARAAALPAGIAPGRDLWPDIAARIAAEGAPHAPRPEPGTGAEPITRAAGGEPVVSRRGAAFAWGGAGALAVAAAVVWFLLARAPAPRPGGAVSPPAGQPAAAALLEPALRELQAGSAVAEAGYAAALRSREHPLPSAADATIRDGLDGIDKAIEDTRAALANAPLDPGLLRLLTAGYRSRIDLLQRATRLTARL